MTLPILAAPLPQRPLAILRRSLVAALLLSGMSPAAAQTAGTLKGNFNPAPIPGAGSLVSTIQADGKVIVGTSSALVRLNTDGSTDPGFSPPAGLGSVVSLAAGPNLKTTVITTAAASSDEYDDFTLTRLQADGAVDPLFTQVTLHGSADSTELHTFVLAVQPDEKAVLAGALLDPSSTSHVGPYVHLVRYNSDGSLDTTFTDPFADSSLLYNAVVALANGKILVAGSFVIAYHMVYYQDGLVALLDADSTLAESYVSSSSGGASGAYAPTLLPDGRIVYLADEAPVAITGPTGPPGGVPRRLNADFTPDTSFAAQFAAGASFTSLVVQSNGKMVLGGYTSSSGGSSPSASAAGVLRLDADGSTDATFDPGAGANEGSSVDTAYVAPDGGIVVVGGFSNFDGSPRNGIAALYGDGGLDEPFFDGEYTLSDGVYYLALPNGNPFGFYAFLDDPHYLYHVDLGFEYVIQAADSRDGLYLYDFKSKGFFYTSASFPFPYLYDFSLDSVVYYYPDPQDATHYNTDGVRYFYDFAAGRIISK